MNPLISVIVPVYKVEEYLPQCIESILAQTYRNLEIILIDDGSPDRCPQICDEYARKDPRICVIHQKNQGVSAARNAGLERATGDYIGFVDGDNSISPVMYENLLKLIEQYRVQIAMCRFRKVVSNQFPDDENPQSGILPIEKAIAKILIPGYYNCSLWNKLFDCRLFNGCQPVILLTYICRFSVHGNT